MASRRWISWAVLASLFGASLYLSIAPAPKLSIGIANGSYYNSDVGTLILRNGRMTINGQYVSYVIESDKGGPYVLPESYVGILGRSFLIRRNSYPLKLRLDDAYAPRSINLIDDQSDNSFDFVRVKRP